MLLRPLHVEEYHPDPDDRLEEEVALSKRKRYSQAV